MDNTHNYTHMADDEKALIEACQQGDVACFGSLYDRYVRKIYTFIFYKTHHKETAEDLTSQTFFKALDKIQQIDPEKSFGAWLYRIARNTVIDHYRSKKINADIDDMWDLTDETDFIHDLDVKTTYAHVEKHLHKLKSGQRDIIFMRVWQGMSYKEISEVVGKSEQNCKVIFSRSIAKLREIVPLIALLILGYNIFI